MLDTFRIPATLDDAGRQLTTLSQFLLAKNWERAAIVYAWTEEDKGGGNPAARRHRVGKRPVSCTAFARMGISGLRDKHTVMAYRKAWKTAIALGKAYHIKAGDTVFIPDLAWPPPADVDLTLVERAIALPGQPDPETERAMVTPPDPEQPGAVIQTDPVAFMASQLPASLQALIPDTASRMPRPVPEPEQPRPRPPVTGLADLKHAVTRLKRVVEKGISAPDMAQARFLARTAAELTAKVLDITDDSALDDRRA